MTSSPMGPVAGLTDRHVLVVGGTGGIGQSVAGLLATMKVAGLALGVRDLDRGAALAGELQARTGTPVVPVSCDLSAASGPAVAVSAARTRLGSLDSVVSCAGNPPWGDLQTVTEHDWAESIETMLLGPIRLLRACLPVFTAEGFGRVVLVGGLSGRQPAGASIIPGVVCAGLANAVTAVAKDAVAAGVTVNVIEPHTTETPRWQRRLAGVAERQGVSTVQVAEQLLADVPRRRPVPVQDVASTVAFLLSDGASSIAGSAIAVDGAAAHGLY